MREYSGFFMAASSSPAQRRKNAVESFKTASDCLGVVEHGMSLFAITRGQFSMIDIILAVLDQVGRARLSVWTWTIAGYEIECFKALQQDDRLYDSLLIIDGQARLKNSELIADWKRSFGSDSVKYVMNHAKIATIETDTFRILVRGSMNLNFNARFEQLDITEGGVDFDMIKRIESEIPCLPDDCSSADAFRATRAQSAFEPEKLKLFDGVKTWAK